MEGLACKLSELRVRMSCVGLKLFRHLIWEFPKMGVPYFGVLIIRILLFRVLY